MDNPTPGSQLKASITDASAKIEGIIDDAERAAAEIKAEARADAEREARALVSKSAADLAKVVEPLVQRVENLRVEAAALMHELENATLKLVELTKKSADSAAVGVRTPVEEPAAEETRPEPPQVIKLPERDAPAERPEPAARPEPVSAPGPNPIAYPGTGASDSAPSETPEEAVLRATQMAVAGNSRSEIEATLADEFGLADATPVVDDILGPA